MSEEKLIKYVQRELETGAPREKVKETLIAAGWNEDEVEDSLKVVFNGENTEEEKDKKRKIKMDLVVDDEKPKLFFITLLIFLGIILFIGLLWAFFREDSQTILQLFR